jgi:protein-S-isoprenylcysteine O-methyltransferase Ste14
VFRDGVAMPATDFEFRNRFWVMGIIFWLGFFCYSFDPVNAGAALLGAHTPTSSTPLTVSVAGVRLVFPSLAYETFGMTPGSEQGRWKLQLIFGLAALLVAAAAMMRTWATAYLQSDVVQDPKLRTEAVVADGPYRYVRNPLYFANVLMAVSMGLLASRTGWFVIVLIMTIFQYRLIGREEAELLRTQGQRYRAYLEAVPRLFPSLSPRLRSGDRKPRWKQAWLTEAFFFWGFAAAMAAFAATLNVVYFFAIFGLSMMCFVLVVPLWKRRRV